MPKFKDLTDEQKRKLLIEAYKEDGADTDIAYDAAKEDKDPDDTLRNVFGYRDDTEVN